jgi:CPA1 family monovalent cation:H+ antiporter
VLLSIFDLVAILLTVSAVFAFVNAKLLRLPTTIGVMIMGLAASLILIGIELLTAETELSRALSDAVRQIDFTEALMHGMLAFMLFAGALQVDLAGLKSRAASVGLLATVGVVVSTAIVGVSFWLVAGWLGSPIPLVWALVFGALISPTDPVAVLSILKAVHVPKDTEVEMTGEALLNDGVGVVAGASDDITTPEQVLDAVKYLGTPKDRIVQKTVPGGHIGLFMGARTLKEYWPPIARWIAAQSI